MAETARLATPAKEAPAKRRTPLDDRARPSLMSFGRQVMHLQRSAGNRAVTAVVQRQTETEGAYKVISQVWQVADRDIVVVATGHSDQALFFYRRTGLGNKGVGVAPEPGKWAPFKTLMEQDESILGGKARAGKPWINKQPYYTQVAHDDPLRGMANTRNQQVGAWLDRQGIPAGQAKDWQVVEQEMDNVAGKYRASFKGGGGGGDGGGAKAATDATDAGAAETKGGAAETKAAGIETKALGAEAKLVGVESAAVKAENVLTKGAQIAGGAAKAARVSELIIALGMPGPQDVFFMFIAAFASIAEAKAKLRADAYATGFAQGLAAVITWTSAEDATNMLMYKVIDPSIGERSSGFAGIREKGTNEGIHAGWKFGNALKGSQRKGFRAEALAATGLKEKRHSNRDDLIDMGAALRPDVIALLEEAERQEEEKRRREYIADMANHPVYH